MSKKNSDAKKHHRQGHEENQYLDGSFPAGHYMPPGDTCYTLPPYVCASFSQGFSRTDEMMGMKPG